MTVGVFLALRWVFKATAMACFMGIPAARSIAMFLPTAFLLADLISGISLDSGVVAHGVISPGEDECDPASALNRV